MVLAHPRRKLLHAMELRIEIDRKASAPGLEVHLFDGATRENCRIIDDDIGPAEFPIDGLAKSLPVRLDGYVACRSGRRRACQRGRFLGRFEIDKKDVGPALRELYADRTADAPARAGDDCHLSLEQGHVLFLLNCKLKS